MDIPEHGGRTRPGPLTLAALGVVYGDIGTSPLYAFKEAFAGPHGLPATEAHVLAALSALFWSVMLIVSVKYVGIVLRFHNDGEGGVLALTALAHRLATAAGQRADLVIGAGIFAAALFYGDAVITPAISVLSAVEGVSVVTPAFERFVVPITLTVIVMLFLIQRHGTGRVGRLFGPVTVVWFLTLGLVGAMSIAETPAVLRALDPMCALAFGVERPGAAFLLLSAVFLALTGGEALYADMGHFGAGPVRLAWYGVVCPALLLNYFGQGALVLRSPGAAANPFYLLVPDAAVLPLVVLATAATVIASQATITGAYSMTLQASRLGYLPRLQILHTSDAQRGQIYIPTVNWLMLGAVVWLVIEFRSSGALAAAYGIAVSGTMIITTLLALSVTRRLRGRFRLPLASALTAFLGLECLFFLSNLMKIADGGWLPLALGLAIFLGLTTWRLGSRRVSEQRRRLEVPTADFASRPLVDVPRVPGVAVYLTSDPARVPGALFHNLKHFQVLHERIVLLNVVNEVVPRIADIDRVQVRALGQGLWSVAVRFGFREEPDVPAALERSLLRTQDIDPALVTYFVARSTIVDGPGGLPAWRRTFFAWMTRQAESAASHFRLPPNRVVELGTHVML
ncbi:MAG: potassium transporter Kup [Burkholderiales bacterium]